MKSFPCSNTRIETNRTYIRVSYRKIFIDQNGLFFDSLRSRIIVTAAAATAAVARQRLGNFVDEKWSGCDVDETSSRLSLSLYEGTMCTHKTWERKTAERLGKSSTRLCGRIGVFFFVQRRSRRGEKKCRYRYVISASERFQYRRARGLLAE